MEQYNQRMDTEESEPSLLCHDCGIEAWMFEEDGQLVHEDFYVSNELWDSVWPDYLVHRYCVNGMEFGEGHFIICIGCFEKRLGRELSRRDLRVEPLALFGMSPSRRFRSRWAPAAPRPEADQPGSSLRPKGDLFDRRTV